LGGLLGVVGKPLVSESDLIECISKNFRTKVWKILNFESIFLDRNSNKLQKKNCVWEGKKVHFELGNQPYMGPKAHKGPSTRAIMKGKAISA
jgi:hypothetical protein